MEAMAFVAVLLPCAGMSAVFLVYICLLCVSVRSNNGNEEAVEEMGKGLSAGELEKIPKVIGKELAEGKDCAVCLDEIEGEQMAKMVPGCKHGFHSECADAWLAKKSVCPVCRGEVLSSETIPC